MGIQYFEWWMPVYPNFAQIGDVANLKRHQRLDEILIFFFTRTTSEKSAKLFSKNSVMQYTRET